MPKSVTRTLRIDQELDGALAKIAGSERVSFNFLAGRCLRRFVEWDGPAANIGVVSVPGVFLKELIADEDMQTLESLGRKVAREVLKPATEYLLGEFTVANAVEILRRSSLYGRAFGFDLGEGRDSHSHVLMLKHDEGLGGSKYYAGLLDGTFRELLGQTLRLSCTDTLCVAQLTLRDIQTVESISRQK